MITFAETPTPAAALSALQPENDPVYVLADAMRRFYTTTGTGPTEDDLALKTNMDVEEIRRLAPKARPLAAKLLVRHVGGDR